MHPTATPGLDRRGFLKFGLMGTGLLLGAGALGSLQGCATHQLVSQPERPLRLLREKDAVILAAVLPVVLKGSFPADPVARQQSTDRMLIQVDEFLLHSSEFTHGELKMLFDLLHLPPTRALVAGLWRPWDEASEDDIEAFLTRWRDSRLNLLRMGYAQLTQLVSLMYYSDSHHWGDLYPGPPQHLPG